MILKDLDPFTSADAFAKAGRRAEEQMAFYLRRAFAASPEVRVLNGIRLEHPQDVAQMDHLILHRWGVIIVESKSVTSRVDINERGEWTRLWNGRPKGMPSPVLQARRQGEFLRHYLEDHAEVLLSKILGLVQGRFGNLPVDVIAAVSDDGIIKQPRKGAEEAVCKADQVPDRILALINGHKKAASIFNLNPKGGYQWSDQELERITAFLLEHHKPLAASTASPAVAHEPLAAPTQPAPLRPTNLPSVVANQTQEPVSVSAAPSPAHSCRTCHGKNIIVEYGRYGYYFKCADCDGNTPIKATCAGCGEESRIRKSGLQFFADCESCGRSDLFYVNHASTTSSATDG